MKEFSEEVMKESELSISVDLRYNRKVRISQIVPHVKDLPRTFNHLIVYWVYVRLGVA
jgi:hypothetical protein